MCAVIATHPAVKDVHWAACQEQHRWSENYSVLQFWGSVKQDVYPDSGCADLASEYRVRRGYLFEFKSQAAHDESLEVFHWHEYNASEVRELSGSRAIFFHVSSTDIVGKHMKFVGTYPALLYWSIQRLEARKDSVTTLAAEYLLNFFFFFFPIEKMLTVL